MLVDDIHVHVVDRAAERDPFAVRRPVHDLVVGVVRGLGQPVGVDQLDPGLGGEPALGELLLQRLAGDRHAAQVGQLAGVLLQVGQHDLEVGRHDLEHGDPAVDDRVDEPLDVQDHLLLDQQRPAADQQRGDQLPQRDVEALRRGLGDHLPLADLQVVDLGVEVVEHARVLAHRALGLAGGAGGEVDVGELVGRDGDAEVAVGVVLLVGRRRRAAAATPGSESSAWSSVVVLPGSVSTSRALGAATAWSRCGRPGSAARSAGTRRRP